MVHLLSFNYKVDAISNHLYPWRHMPNHKSCIVESHPMPPLPVNASYITIQNLIWTNKRLYLNVSWEPITIPHGNIIKSELRIAHEHLLPSDEDDPTDYPYTHTIKVILLPFHKKCND